MLGSVRAHAVSVKSDPRSTIRVPDITVVTTADSSLLVIGSVLKLYVFCMMTVEICVKLSAFHTSRPSTLNSEGNLKCSVMQLLPATCACSHIALRDTSVEILKRFKFSQFHKIKIYFTLLLLVELRKFSNHVYILYNLKVQYRTFICFVSVIIGVIFLFISFAVSVAE